MSLNEAISLVINIWCSYVKYRDDLTGKITHLLIEFLTTIHMMLL